MVHYRFGSVLLLTATLTAGCSTPRTNDGSGAAPAAAADATAPSAAAPKTDVALGAYDNPAAISATSLANATQAAESGLGSGNNLVHFAYDSDALSAEDQALLQRHAAFMKANPKVTVRLEGHTDVRGTSEYNLALGERRGKAAAIFLQSHGVAPAQLEVISYGELKPRAAGDDETAWAQNRRVEIVYR